MVNIAISSLYHCNIVCPGRCTVDLLSLGIIKMLKALVWQSQTDIYLLLPDSLNAEPKHCSLRGFEPKYDLIERVMTRSSRMTTRRQ